MKNRDMRFLSKDKTHPNCCMAVWYERGLLYLCSVVGDKDRSKEELLRSTPANRAVFEIKKKLVCHPSMHIRTVCTVCMYCMYWKKG